MKKSFVTRLLSFSLAATMALSQGVTSYAANFTDDASVVASSLVSTDDEDAASKENSDDLGEETPDDPSTGSELEDETETDDNKKDDKKSDDNSGASDASSDASSDEESASDASSEASSDDESASDASSLASSDDAASEASSEAASEASSEASSKETDEIDYPDGINPLPEGYDLSESVLEMKNKIEENGVLDQFKTMTEGKDYVKNEIVTLASDEEMAELIAKTYSGKLVDFSYGVATISLSDSELSVEDAFVYSLDDDLDLPLVEPNYYASFVDPVIADSSDKLYATSPYVHSSNYFAERWYNDKFTDPFLNPENDHYQWHHSMINTYAAWGVTTGNSNVTVAVIDTGVNTGHNDLKGGPIEAHDIGAGSGDQNGHGTHVAGIIAGRLNNSMGAGVAPGVKILALRASDGGSSASFSTANIWRALMYAGGLQCTINESGSRPTCTNIKIISGGRKADIVNMSLGGPIYSPYYENIIKAMYDAGVTVVAAMGNESANHKSYPAAYKHVIAVAAVNETGSKSYYTTYGAWADIAAPGSMIYSTDYSNENGYVYMDGTSMACPVVAGACALYMSAYGHVDPDTMERAIRSSVSGSAGAGTGTGILNLAKMFNGDTTAPLVSLVSGAQVVGETYEGKAFTIPTEVNSASVITFTPMGFDAKDISASGFTRGAVSSANSGTTIVYTTNGTNPSVSNGEVLNGTALLRDSSGKIPSVKVSDLINNDDKATSQKITVKAIAVTGMGVSSKMSTLVFTVDKTKKNAVALGTETVKIVNAPKKLIAGKSIKLDAVVTDSANAKVSQKVTWRIDYYSDGDLSKAKINAANGTLTTNAAQTGKLVISCTSADTRATGKVTIEVTKDYAVAGMAIEGGKPKNLSLKFVTGESNTNPVSATIKLTTLTDAAKHNLLTDSIYSYNNKTFQWITSNSKVVKISESTGISANISAVSVGTATITCKALDGSGKSAKITVNVGYEKKATSVVISNAATKAATPVTALSTYVGASATTLKATVNYADGKTNRVTPVWTSSNEKIVKVSSSGVVTPVAKGAANITCAVPDGSGKKAVVKVTVVQRVEKIEVDGQQFVAPGTTAKMAAAVTPAAANNKNVKWEVSGAPAGVSIANGVLKLPKDIAVGTKVVVKATSVDGSAKTGSFTVTVCPRATKVTITSGGQDVTGKGLVLSTKGINGYSYPTSVQLKAVADNGTKNVTPVVFTTNNAKVATVDKTTGKVVAVAKGAAVITATAQDGSGKKSVVKISVVQPVESVSVTGQPSLAIGTAATFKATMLPASANNKAVTWTLQDTSASNKVPTGITIASNGAVKVTKDAPIGHVIKVVATHSDNGNKKEGSITFKVTDAKAASVIVTASGADSVNAPVYVKGSSEALSSIKLYSTNYSDSKGKVENQITLNNKVVSTINTDLTDKAQVVWSSSNASIVSVSKDSGRSIVIKALKAGTANITCAAQDGSGKKAVVKVTVAQAVESVKVSGGQPTVAAGNATTYKAAVLPANATNKAVTWTLQDTSASNKVPAGITITNGTVKLTKDAPVGHVIRVIATHDVGDGNIVKDTAATFKVTAAKAGAVTVKATDADTDVNAPSYSKGTASTLNFARLYTVNIPGNSKNETTLTLSHQITSTENKNLTGTVPVVWASSNPKVVSVSNTSGTSITIQAHKAGSASITCAAQDGSGKKAIINVSVIIPASNIEVSTGTDVISSNYDNVVCTVIGAGKSTTIRSALGKVYGNPSVTKIAWDYELGTYNNGKFTKLPDSYKATYQKNKDVFSFANGKVTANAVAALRKAINKYPFGSGSIALRAIARTTDGTKNEDSMIVMVTNPATYLRLYFPDGTMVQPYHVAILDSKVYESVYLHVRSNAGYKAYSVVSSDPNIASGYVSDDELLVFPHGKGTVTFTVSTLDGSGQKASVKIQVK